MSEGGISEKGVAFDWQAAYKVTPEKIEELVRRIVAKGNPLQVTLFGSQVRVALREISRYVQQMFVELNGLTAR